MSPSPRVSVIATVYNGEEYFDRGPRSILEQSYQDVEFVVVDDGSSDGTAEKLRALAAQHPHVRVFTPGRLGRVKALNYAVSQARGRYIAVQDFDDVSYPDRLKAQVAYLDAHADTALVGGQYVIVDENRGERYLRRPPRDHAAIVRCMAKFIPFAHTIVMFRKDAWQQAGRYPDMDDVEDLSLWIQFVRLGWKVANLDEVLGEHLVHQASYWHRNFRYDDRQRRQMRVHLQAIRELGLPWWMHVYPASRLAYMHMPTVLKQFLRRRVVGLKEGRVTPSPECVPDHVS